MFNKLVLCLTAQLCILPFFVKSDCPEIISRTEWGARSAISKSKLKANPPPFVVVHHSATPECTTLQKCKNRVKQIQSYHIDNNKWEDVGYNFLIGGDGNIYEGRGWGIHGAHVPKYNSKSIGICLIGNYSNDEPSQLQLDALKKLIQCAKESNYIDVNYRLIGHRQGGQTTCPGDKAFNVIKTWPNFDRTVSP